MQLVCEAEPADIKVKSMAEIEILDDVITNTLNDDLNIDLRNSNKENILLQSNVIEKASDEIAVEELSPGIKLENEEPEQSNGDLSVNLETAEESTTDIANENTKEDRNNLLEIKQEVNDILQQELSNILEKSNKILVNSDSIQNGTDSSSLCHMSNNVSDVKEEQNKSDKLKETEEDISSVSSVSDDPNAETLQDSSSDVTNKLLEHIVYDDEFSNRVTPILAAYETQPEIDGEKSPELQSKNTIETVEIQDEENEKLKNKPVKIENKTESSTAPCSVDDESSNETSIEITDETVTIDAAFNENKANSDAKTSEIPEETEISLPNVNTNNGNRNDEPIEIADETGICDNSTSNINKGDINDESIDITDEAETSAGAINADDSNSNVILQNNAVGNENLQATSANNVMDVDEVIEETQKQSEMLVTKDDIVVVDEINDNVDSGKETANSNKSVEDKISAIPNSVTTECEKEVIKPTPVICKLSNTLDILSDDDEESNVEPVVEEKVDLQNETPTNALSANIDYDDDIMVIEEDSKENKIQEQSNKISEDKSSTHPDNSNTETSENKTNFMESIALSSKDKPEEVSELLSCEPKATASEEIHEDFNKSDILTKEENSLLPEDFLNSTKKNLSEMTRDELEDFCVLKIVESVVDRTNLNDIKAKLKTITQGIEEFKKKTLMLTKQNRDLQVVLKSVQEEQKKKSSSPITPLKITRSVGMQVLMVDRPTRKKPTASSQIANANTTKTKPNQNMKNAKPATTENIPVPRLILASNVTPRSNVSPATTNPRKSNVSPVNGVVPNPAQKPAEKRTHSRSQSVTVDLTSDEPPSKIAARNAAPSVRVVPPQNLMAPQRAQFSNNTSPRKVYIPISSPQNVRMTLPTKVSTGPRHRSPGVGLTRVAPNQIRVSRPGSLHRHPAPLPDIMKQYHPPNWKALPPAPDIKLSKVENGIVISWKIEGYQEDNHEEIASYQIYAYQETSAPPSTAHWMKIGDVKALPLPMACTLTQFRAGYKYYFSVRAVDVKSRLGPFSYPGNIFLNK